VNQPPVDNSRERRENQPMQDRNSRQVYLLTYSQADEEKIPSRERFANAVVNAFSHCQAQILRWVCSKESGVTTWR